MRTHSILGLMFFVLACGIGFAALRSENNTWAGILALTTLVLTGVAILGAFHGQGRGRAWWLGFALFCGGYQLPEDRPLITTKLLAYAYSNVTPGEYEQISGGRLPPLTLARRFVPFRQVGHSLFAVLAGLIGAWVSVWFWGRRKAFAPGAE